MEVRGGKITKFFIVAARHHRINLRYIVRADELLPAFTELERQTRYSSG